MDLEETDNLPWRDPIVEEIRKVRQEHAAQFGYDLDAIVEDFRKREQEGPYKVVTLPPQHFRATAKNEQIDLTA